MSYEDYLRDWKVKFPGAAECETDSIVTFAGGPGAVTVVCTSDGTSKRPYPPGMYVPTSNTIKREGEYTLSMMDGKPRTITFTPEGGPLAGSWTANDTGSWPDEG